MKKYLYKAKNNKGEVLTGTVKAENDLDAEEILLRHGLSVIDMVQEKGFSIRFFQSRITMKDKALFARQLSTMVSAGLELSKAIKVSTAQARTDRIRSMLLDIYNDLEEGNSFSASLAKHSDAFDPVFISVVAAGEATGKLDVVLKQLADQLENDNNFVAKIRGAMYYPAFILCALVGIASYMLVKVVPQIKGLFDSAHTKLPAATRALLAISNFMIHSWWIALIVAVGLIIFLRYWAGSKSGGKVRDMLQIKLPVIKNLYENIYMYRFSRVMSMLVGTGVPLLEALKIAATTMNNGIYERSIARIIGQVEKGVPLSVQLSKDPIFPQLIGQMAAVGEETGQLDNVFSKVADYYEDASEQMVRTVSTLIEPAILLVIGAGVAFIVFAILVPIYQISQLQV